MNVYNFTRDENIEQARLMFVKHFKDEEFLKRIEGARSFNHTVESGFAVANSIRSFEEDVYLRQYTPWNPWTKAIAYAELPNIYFNSRKNLPAIERVETIAHECMHLMGYSHKGNYVTKYNLQTVPYRVASEFKEYCRGIYG